MKADAAVDSERGYEAKKVLRRWLTRMVVHDSYLYDSRSLGLGERSLGAIMVSPVRSLADTDKAKHCSLFTVQNILRDYFTSSEDPRRP